MTDPNDSDAPTVGTTLGILRRRKWWVIGVTLLGLVGSLGYSLHQAKTYSASAQVLDSPANAAISGSASQITPTDVLTELQLVTSAPVQDAVARKLGSTPDVIAAQVGQTNVISIIANAPNPKSTALIANTYATAFVNYRQAVSNSNLTAAETQLSQQIATINAQATALGTGTAVSGEVVALLNQETTLKEQLAQLQVAGVTGGGVAVITPATAPSAPSSPKPAHDAFLGLILGFLLGIGLALLVEQLDGTVHRKDEVERLTLGAHVLASVPVVRSRRNRPFIVTMTKPNSMAGEAYRSLRTSLQFAALDTEARVILVTSPGEAEGKTTTVVNLGVVLAEAGQRVAIVSCDLRRPRVSQYFGSTNAWV